MAKQGGSCRFLQRQVPLPGGVRGGFKRKTKDKSHKTKGFVKLSYLFNKIPVFI
jgi:hypothetical protein